MSSRQSARAGYAESVLLGIIVGAIDSPDLWVGPKRDDEEHAEYQARAVIAALDEKGWPAVL